MKLNNEKPWPDLTDLGTILGSYTPHGFTISLEQGDFPKSYQPGTAGFSTFIHEYTHYLQNIATVSGLSEFLDYMRFIYSIGAIIQGGPKIAIPVSNSSFPGIERWIAPYKENGEWLGVVIGGPKYDTPETDGEVVNDCFEPYTLVHKGKSHPTKRWKLMLRGPYGELPYYIGSLAIRESIARNLEALIEGQYRPHPFIPYKIVETRLRSLFPWMGPPEFILVCHASLMHEVPAVALNNFIGFLLKSKSQLMGNDLFNHIFELEIAHEREFEKSLIAITKRFELLKSDLQKSVLSSSIEWISQTAHANIEFLKKDPLHFMRPLMGIKPGTSWADHLAKAIESLPSPPIFSGQNGTGQVYSIQATGNDKSPFVFTALKHLAQVLTSTNHEKACPFFNRCRLAPRDEAICTSEPWKQADNGPSCPYGWAAAGIGLRGKA